MLPPGDMTRWPPGDPQHPDPHPRRAPSSAVPPTTAPVPLQPPLPTLPPLALPDRNVTAATIEEAFVQFILYCNPAVPPGTDTAALREAFRTPPRSGGKTFDTFFLYQLIRQLEDKVVKTWGELALRLGVEPPDQEKGQSSQKVQQYHVRLKRWMRSTRIDVFFEYLIGRVQNTYWTDIPLDPHTVPDVSRNGVAPENDMALRALLPHIRPRRGRKREDDEGRPPHQRQRLDIDSPSAQEPHGLGPAPPDRRSPISTSSDAIRPGGTGLAPPAHDAAQTPKSAASRRHGAKVVSSAWGSASAPGGKVRGRPRLSRASEESSFHEQLSNFSAASVAAAVGDGPGSMAASDRAEPATSHPPYPPLNAGHPPEHGPGGLTNPPPNHTGPALPLTEPSEPDVSLGMPGPGSNLDNPDMQPPPVPCPAFSTSAQVPTFHSLAAATPVNPNGSTNLDETSRGDGYGVSRPIDDPYSGMPPGVAIESLDYGKVTVPAVTRPASSTAASSAATAARSIPTPAWQPRPTGNPPKRSFFDAFGDDRTNIDSLYSHFVLETMMADWVDEDGNPTEPCAIEEAHAVISSVIESLYRHSTSNESFLINVAALAGGKMLMTTSRMRLKRLQDLGTGRRYTCSWDYRLGAVKGSFSMTQDVSYDLFRPGDVGTNGGSTKEEAEEGSSRYWKQKYEDLSRHVQKSDRHLLTLKTDVVASLKDGRMS
ncbi:uncharacterized protein DNG_06622 [Cephalotrichum gorgonifer]|uniref:ARS binding protein 2 n=1 Tax=Cephalotrichum gorgonifer TaxID=2041049 RepID=A0AAE8N1Y9_9PEZI|nr:uncharacterized protein DNG_06622 [Cephalotrichum gorgonifer]